MLASNIPREQWQPFLEHFNLEHAGDLVRVERHQPGLGIIFEVESCIFERIHDDHSGEYHRIGVVVGEPCQNQETYFMTDPRQVLWYQDDEAMHNLRIEGVDGRFLIVRVLEERKAVA
jgi:hypothetical protein